MKTHNNTTHYIWNRCIRYGLLTGMLVTLMVLQGCGGGGGGVTTYTIGGTVTGLTGTGLELQNNDGDDLPITDNGDFTFSTSLSNNSSYAVTILNPSSGQVCTVTNGSDTVPGANVTNIAVDCDQDASGLFTGTGLVNSGTDNLTAVKGMVYGNRFIFFDVAQHVLYDGQITSITGDVLSATVNVYKNGVILETGVSVTGTVTTRSRIQITLGGTGFASGDLDVTFDALYDRGATNARINSVATNWVGPVRMDISGMETNDFEVVDTNSYSFVSLLLLPLSACQHFGSLSIPNTAVNIFTLQDSIVIVGGQCTTSKTPDYSGLATVVDGGGLDNTLWYAVTNGNNSVFAILTH